MRSTVLSDDNLRDIIEDMAWHTEGVPSSECPF